MNNFITRVLIGIVGIPAILAIIIFGKIYFLLFLAVVTAISQYEFYKMYRAKKQVQSYYVHGIIFGLIWMFVTYFASEYFYHLTLIPTMLFLVLNLRGDIVQSTEKFAISVSGYLYIPVLLSTLIMIRQLGYYTSMSDAEAWKMVIVLFVAIWINDTFGGPTPSDQCLEKIVWRQKFHPKNQSKEVLPV